MAENNVLLEIKNLSKRFGGVVAVDRFTAAIRPHHLIGIIGPNGAGKTTILNLLSGIYQSDSGQIFYAGKEITNKPSFAIGRMGIARTFQNIRLFEEMSVLDNVRSAYSWRAEYGLLKAMVGWRGVSSFEHKIIDQSLYWLEKVGLTEHRNTPAGSLPYGKQRRVEMARALAGDPRLLLLDEPAAGLNPAEVRDLIDLIHKLYDELKLSIILIEHRMEVVMELCQWIHVQNFGSTIAQGTPEQIQKDPIVINAYLGEEFTCSR
jgi:branched-chain amino acid transport system ATP-binding protein